MAPRLLHYSDVENAYDDPAHVGRLAGLLQSLDGADAVVAGAGDDTAPGVLSLATEGRQAVPFFEAVGTDVETFGNHDFDFGPDAALDVVRASPQTWVAANVRRDGRRFGKDAGVVPWTVIDADGARVGVFGVVDPATASINPKTGDVTFGDPLAAATEAVAALREAGVDHVVALSHLGNGDDELARAVDLDAVLGGHVHSERRDRVDGTLLTRPGAGGHVVFEVDLDAGSVTRHAVGEDPVDGNPVDEGLVDEAPVDEVLSATLRELERETGLEETVGRVGDPILRDESVVFGGECRVGNFVADAYRWAADADVGLQNSGGIRDGPPLAGAVTAADVVGLVPFEEPVVVAAVDGDDLRALLREAASGDVAFDEEGWWHGHVSGLRAEFDAAGDLLAATVDGEAVRAGERYTVATSGYLLHTDHEFPTLTEDHRVDALDTQYEVLLAYAREVGIDPSVDGRLVRHGG